MTDTHCGANPHPSPSVERADPAGNAARSGEAQAPRGWCRLGRQLHALSRLKVLFFAVAFYFQVRTMFFSAGQSLLDNLNRTLLMYGIAMSFEGLRDASAISEKRQTQLRRHPAASRWTVVTIFAGGLFSMAVGCSQFFLANNRELGWATTAFGLGMMSLGRQHYDQLVAVHAAMRAADPGDTPGAGLPPSKA